VLAAVFISLIAMIVIGFTLKESNSSVRIQIPIQKKENMRKVFSQECKEFYNTANPADLKFKDIFKLKRIPFLLILYFFIFLGFNIYYTSFPIHAVAGLKWSITQMGIFYAVLSGFMVVVLGPILRKALQRFSEEKLVIIGSIILATNFILFISNNIILIYSAAILFAVGNGLMWPYVMSILSKCAGSVHQGVVQGIAGSFGGLASIIGLKIEGLLYNLIGVYTFLISATVIFVVFIMSFRLLKIKEPIK
jgi:MFS transporter, DHA1 family, tetracycline resistance protein